MFYGRMEEHTVEKPLQQSDGLGFTYSSWETQENALIYLTQFEQSVYTSNELKVNQLTTVGYTQVTAISKGWRIDGKYIVTEVRECKGFNVLTLENYE